MQLLDSLHNMLYSADSTTSLVSSTQQPQNPSTPEFVVKIWESFPSDRTLLRTKGKKKMGLSDVATEEYWKIKKIRRQYNEAVQQKSASLAYLRGPTLACPNDDNPEQCLSPKSI
eukprot:GHVP01069163.1.p1 GENE.GHVP01069163.1~~GHVP01069163.1.p1  ORF type:complete len:115 (+),score=13.87 GHVP01069163.1:135-479(+)